MTSATVSSFAPTFLASASAARGATAVSVHDVAPATWEKSQRIVHELQRLRIDAISLLVVPDYHGSGRSMADRAFVDWLRNAEADGHEVIVHGYYHQRPRRAQETVRDKCITRFYTNDEGEFYDLAYAEALMRLTRAREEFHAAGITPQGFIAPAWLLGIGGENAARDVGFEYTTRIDAVRDLRAGVNYKSRSLVYSVRNEWRRTASLAWNALLLQRLKSAPLIRLGLHPPDLDHPAVWAQIERTCRTLADTRTPVTYGTWVGQCRTERKD